MSTRAHPLISEPVREANIDQYLNGPMIAVALVAIGLGARLFWIIRKYSVNIFFMDQWDYLTLFFNHQSTIRHLFFWEHGPHREGVGLLPDKFLYPLFHWDARVDSYLIGGAIFVAMLLALRLKYLLFGSMSYSDVAIPVTFLTVAQHETLLSTPNPAHSGFPLLLIVLYCLALLAHTRSLQYGLVLLLNFLLINTGFGIFMAAVTIGFFLLECYWSWRGIKSVPFSKAFTALCLAIASLASFFFHYIFQSAAGCFELPHDNWLNYPQFMGVLLSAFVVPRPLTLSMRIIVLGAGILLLMVAVLCWQIVHLLKSPAPEVHLVGAALIGFSLLFAANNAVGRQCLGMEQAFSSRYCTLLIPAFLGMYFFLLSQSWFGMRNILLAVWVILLLPSSLMIPYADINWYSAGKRQWADCYRQTGSIHYCDESTHFVLYPAPSLTHLQEKLDYLKQNHLTLFAKWPPVRKNR
jgi:hypothetical protein